MDKIEDKLIILVAVLMIIGFVCSGFLYVNRIGRQGQCDALNGVYLTRDEICLNLEKIKLAGDK
jgi:hypothetical protein